MVPGLLPFAGCAVCLGEVVVGRHGVFNCGISGHLNRVLIPIQGPFPIKEANEFSVFIQPTNRDGLNNLSCMLYA